jgi:hypothetical protein
MNNQKLAIKLFTQKPTYQALDWEKKWKDSRETISRIKKVCEVKPGLVGSNMSMISGGIA